MKNQKQPDLQVWGQRDTMSPNYHISLAIDNGEDYFIGLPTNFEKVDAGVMQHPTLSLNPATAQALMNELWHLGLRPSNESTTGMLAVQTRHLEDMRALAFAKTGVDLPGKK